MLENRLCTCNNKIVLFHYDLYSIDITLNPETVFNRELTYEQCDALKRYIRPEIRFFLSYLFDTILSIRNYEMWNDISLWAQALHPGLKI